jgi:hypothetical protein
MLRLPRGSPREVALGTFCYLTCPLSDAQVRLDLDLPLSQLLSEVDICPVNARHPTCPHFPPSPLLHGSVTNLVGSRRINGQTKGGGALTVGDANSRL